jgi:hypothetical protein
MITAQQALDLVNDRKPYLAHNHVLLDIFNGNLADYVIADLKKSLSPQVFEQQMFRLAPINILPKIIDKLTNIYQTAVTRQVVDGSTTDKELLDWYVKSYSANDKMNKANELFNLTKTSLIYPYVAQGMPRLRVIKNDRFVVYSFDPIEPEKPTGIIVYGGKRGDVDIYWVWDAYSFMVIDSEGKTRLDIMAEFNNVEGINPVGRLPFVYINKSDDCLYPQQDTDIVRMTKLLPLMTSDLNLSAMFQCFSIIYGIDVNDENIKFAPNAFWSLKSDPTSDKKPEIGTIKPQVDYQQVLGLIQSQLTIWLSTQGIRAGALGDLSAENFASGISKLIDEMDTYEARQKQTTVFQKAEVELWDLTLNAMHPYWSETGMIDNPARWTPTATVATKFAIQLPQQSRGQTARDLKEEYAAGFISRRRALMKLNPEMGDMEIDELIAEIDAERGIIDNAEGNGNTADPAEDADESAT